MPLHHAASEMHKCGCAHTRYNFDKCLVIRLDELVGTIDGTGAKHFEGISIKDLDSWLCCHPKISKRSQQYFFQKMWYLKEDMDAT